MNTVNAVELTEEHVGKRIAFGPGFMFVGALKRFEHKQSRGKVQSVQVWTDALHVATLVPTQPVRIEEQ